MLLYQERGSLGCQFPIKIYLVIIIQKIYCLIFCMSTETSETDIYYIRNNDSFGDLADKIVQWSRDNLANVSQIKGISSTLCHYNMENMISVVYEKELTGAGTYEHSQLCYQIYESDNSWHSITNDFIDPKSNQLHGKGYKILSLNIQEKGQQHKSALVILWYLKP